ncbi:MAG TPA: hypothetical protein VNG53_06805 [Bacteroidia bacterium]|nr:hypothetical protein [Bacteroidia bacterium]
MKFNRPFYFILLMTIVHLSAKAQFMDSLRTSIHKKPTFFFSFDSHTSFISNNEADIWGFVFGVTFNNKINIGGGFNTLSTPFYKNKVVVTDAKTDSIISEQLSFNYWTYYLEYIFYNTKHWQFSFPLEIGLGTSQYQYNYGGKLFSDNPHLIIPIEPAFSITYQFNKWIGFGTEIGYRFMLVNNNNIKQNFNSPTYNLGLQIYIIEIYKSIFPHSKITRKLNGYSD